jgi:hypothetical protein
MRHSPEHQARVKDFADLVLLAQRNLNLAECNRLMSEVFQFWLDEATKHRIRSLPPIPTSVDDMRSPPDEWREPYATMARDMGIDDDMGRAFMAVRRCIGGILLAGPA